MDFKIVSFPLSILEAQGDFSLFTVAPGQVPGGKSHNIVRLHLSPNSSGGFKILILRLLHTEPPVICQLHFILFYPCTGS